ncbi:MAG TPA: L17 family ribosomal protein, partial [Armatimonadota bacterium]
MRHRVSQRKLGLTTDKRMALLKGLVKQLLEHEALETTETRAKEVRVIFEKMIT